LELGRVVLHDHEMSVLRSSRSSVSCVQDQGARPEAEKTWRADASIRAKAIRLLKDTINWF
ncbi:hypothetical protein ACN6K5_006939, partial [Streptomyces violaceoruber]